MVMVPDVGGPVTATPGTRNATAQGDGATGWASCGVYRPAPDVPVGVGELEG